MTRSTIATCVDSWGRQITALAGEVRFPGARRVRNLLSASQAMHAAPWAASVTGIATVTPTSGQSDPWGGTSATKLVFSASNSGDVSVWRQAISVTANQVNTSSIYIRADAPVTMYLRRGATNNVTALAVTTAWQRLEAVAAAATSTTLNFDLTPKPDFLTGTSGATVYVVGAQCEDVTGQSVQTAGEYVSVGTVQRNMLLFSNKFDESVWGGGGATVAQNAASPTGLNCDAGWTVTDANGGATLYIARTALTLTATDYKLTLLVGKTSGATSFPTLAAYHTTPTALAAICTIDTNNGIATPWTAYTGFTIVPSSATCTSHDDTYWKVVLTFTADAASTWRLDIAPASTANATQSTGVLNAAVTGSAKFAAAMLTLASADQTYQPVGGSFQYHGSMVDGVKCFPTDLSGNPLTGMTTPLLEAAATNTCLQSNAFTTAPWVGLSTPTATQNAVGPNGQSNYAWTLEDNNGSAYEGYQQALIAWSAGASGCYSILVEKKASSPSYPCLLMYYNRASNLYHYVIVDEVAGTVAIGGSTNPPAYGCVSFNDDFWLVWVAGTQAGATVSATVDIYPAASVDGTTLSATKQGSTVFCDAQFESGAAYPSSRIATTTGAATRNADQLYYTGALIGQLKSLAVRGFKREVGVSNTGVMAALTDGTAANFNEAYLSSATLVRFGGQASSVAQWDIQTNTYTPGALSNAAWSSATNDIKAAKDGVAQTPDTSATIPTVTRLEIGMSGGAFQLNGYPGKIYGWTRNLSQSEVNGVSA